MEEEEGVQLHERPLRVKMGKRDSRAAEEERDQRM